MATIRVCDWTKKVLPKGEEITKITIGSVEYEVGTEGATLLIDQLEGENEPSVAEPQIVEKIIYRDAPPDSLQSAMPGIDVEVKGDPFDSGPTSMPQAPQASFDEFIDPKMGEPADDAAFDLGNKDDGSELTPLEIPESVNKSLKKPTITQANKVVQDSTHFREGSLAALNPGAIAQRNAAAKMRAMKDRDTNQLNGKANHGIRLKDLNE